MARPPRQVSSKLSGKETLPQSKDAPAYLPPPPPASSQALFNALGPGEAAYLQVQ